MVSEDVDSLDHFAKEESENYLCESSDVEETNLYTQTESEKPIAKPVRESNKRKLDEGDVVHTHISQRLINKALKEELIESCQNKSEN